MWRYLSFYWLDNAGGPLTKTCSENQCGVKVALRNRSHVSMLMVLQVAARLWAAARFPWSLKHTGDKPGAQLIRARPTGTPQSKQGRGVKLATDKRGSVWRADTQIRREQMKRCQKRFIYNLVTWTSPDNVYGFLIYNIGPEWVQFSHHAPLNSHK